MSEPLTASLQDLLRDCAAREKHSEDCEVRGVKFGVEVSDNMAGENSRWIDTEPVCTCDRAERVLARQARVVAAYSRELSRTIFTLCWSRADWRPHVTPSYPQEIEMRTRADATALAAGRAALGGDPEKPV